MNFRVLHHCTPFWSLQREAGYLVCLKLLDQHGAHHRRGAPPQANRSLCSAQCRTVDRRNHTQRVHEQDAALLTGAGFSQSAGLLRSCRGSGDSPFAPGGEGGWEIGGNITRKRSSGAWRCAHRAVPECGAERDCRSAPQSSDRRQPQHHRRMGQSVCRK